MSTARVTVCVTEDTVLYEHALLADTSTPYAWLYVGEGHDAALWGSPAALRRLAAMAVAAADSADQLIAERSGQGIAVGG